MEVSRHLLLLFLVALATITGLSSGSGNETSTVPTTVPESVESSPTNNSTAIETNSTIISEDAPDTSTTNNQTDTSSTNNTGTVTNTSSTDNSTQTTVTPTLTSPNISEPAGNTSVSPSSNVSNSSPPTTSPDSSNLCEGDPCGKIASCVKLNNKSFCLCIEGFYYYSSNKTCTKGKTFPGEITVEVNDTSDLDNKNSLNYQQLHDKVTEFFENALSSTDYQQTVIVSVSTVIRTGRSLKSDTTPVQASIVNIFSQDTKETESSVSDLINKAAKDSDFSDYRTEDRCEYSGCVKDNTNCSDILQCECKPGLQRPNPFSTCSGLNCPTNCNAEKNQQCIKDSNGIVQCVCLPGYKNKTDNPNLLCEACPFGYSGENCENQFQLILTIVGTVAGVLILSLVIALIISAKSKNKNKKLEEQQLIDNDFQNLRLQQTGFSNAGAEGNMFPKVRTSASRDGPSQNPYISQRNIPRPDY